MTMLVTSTDSLFLPRNSSAAIRRRLHFKDLSDLGTKDKKYLTELEAEREGEDGYLNVSFSHVARSRMLYLRIG
jgi:hypothetical protein